jgi:DNA-binding transcriptional LysR family regulator
VESHSQVAAARRLRVTQGTISRHIQRVQEHFGGGLFETGSSGKLSTRGLLVEQSVRSALAELVRTRERIARSAPVLGIDFIPTETLACAWIVVTRHVSQSSTKIRPFSTTAS